uniref:Uncharacterized protein n=1 Tax=Anguilla anguilla TaxID=7936 RepID=A0A0E9SPP4_ANGAN
MSTVSLSSASACFAALRAASCTNIFSISAIRSTASPLTFVFSSLKDNDSSLPTVSF